MNVVADPPMVTVNGVRLELVERGRGRPLLFLHPGIGIEHGAPVLEHLARSARVIVPSHPGFGCSDCRDGMNTVDDLAYFYLDLLDTLDLRDVAVVGVVARRLDRGRDRGEIDRAAVARWCSPTRSASRSATARRATSSTSSR